MVVTYKNSSDSAINLNGYGARMYKIWANTWSFIGFRASNNYVAISNASNGQITINIPANVTDNFNPKHIIMIEIYNTNVSPTFLIGNNGYIQVTPQVTSSADKNKQIRYNYRNTTNVTKLEQGVSCNKINFNKSSYGLRILNNSY